jgi:hypothetical protein
MFDVGKTTLQVWTWRVVHAINYVLRDNIVFPTSAAALDSLATGFHNIANGMGAAIPNTVCAFDGVVVQKCPPPQAQTSQGERNKTQSAAHFYRKGFFGAAMLAFVDAKCRFLSISMACAASCHDSTMFEYSLAGQLLAAGLVDKKYNAVADDAFTCAGHVLTPYSGNSLSPQEDAFNYYLSLQRQVVERAFAIWKRKWGIYWRTLCVSEQHVKLVMEVTCRLHNFCIDREVSPDIEDYIAHDEQYWQTVKPVPINHPRLRPKTVDFIDPEYLDTETRAHFLPPEFMHGAQQTTKRRHIRNAIASQGLLRPITMPAVATARHSAHLPCPAPRV